VTVTCLEPPLLDTAPTAVYHVNMPQTFNMATLETQLTTHLLGRPLRYLPSVASTQDTVRSAAEAGAAEGLVVVAGQQTAGKGRAGRSWWSPPAGGLYLSLLLRPDMDSRRIPWLTMCLALGAAEAIETTCGLRPDIKWPNDLELSGRKLAGILAEGAFNRGRLVHAIMGLGLNVNIDFSLQPELVASAASLQAALGRPLGLTGLLAAILNRVEQHYLALKAGVSPQPAWSARLITLGRPVRAKAADGRTIRGQASHTLPRRRSLHPARRWRPGDRPGRRRHPASGNFVRRIVVEKDVVSCQGRWAACWPNCPTPKASTLSCPGRSAATPPWPRIAGSPTPSPSAPPLAQSRRLCYNDASSKPHEPPGRVPNPAKQSSGEYRGQTIQSPTRPHP